MKTQNPYFSRIFILVAVCSFILSGCKDEDNPSSDPFIGLWEIVRAEGFAASANVGTSYEYKEDGTVSLAGGITTGTYTRSGDQLTLDLNGIVIAYTYTLEEDELIMDANDSDQIFYLEKQ